MSPRVRGGPPPQCTCPDRRHGVGVLCLRRNAASLPLRAPSRDVRVSACECGEGCPGAGACSLCRGCPGAASVCAWAGSPRVSLQRVCARGRGAARGAARAEPSVREAVAGRARRRPAARRKNAGRELFGRSGSPGCGARRGSPRPPGERRARVPAATPPPLPPPASSSFPAPRARASQGRPSGAAPPGPARFAPTPPPPSPRSGQIESACAPARQVGAPRRRRVQVPREGWCGAGTRAGAERPGRRGLCRLPSLPPRTQCVPF